MYHLSGLRGVASRLDGWADWRAILLVRIPKAERCPASRHSCADTGEEWKQEEDDDVEKERNWQDTTRFPSLPIRQLGREWIDG